jgi:HK97 family phage prohead protease
MHFRKDRKSGDSVAFLCDPPIYMSTEECQEYNNIGTREGKEMPDLEKRVMTECEMRVEREDREGNPAARIVGYAAVFNKPTDIGPFREVIVPGAFGKALESGVDVRALFNHDPNVVLGRTSAGTLKLEENTKGLKYTIRPPDTAAARDLLVSIERGDITGSSFGFRTIKNVWRTDDGRDLRELIEVEPFDVSPVTFPAYPQTSVALRSLEMWKECQSRGWTWAERGRLEIQEALTPKGS